METNMNMSMNMQNNDEVEIDLSEILFLLLDKLALILLVGIITAGVAFLGTKFFITPKYQSETQIYVSNSREESTQNANDFVTSNYITKDYEKLITSLPVREKVIADLGLESAGITPASLGGMITVQNLTDTRIICIIVTDTDAYRARKIANAVREVSAVRIKELMKIEDVGLVQEANLNENPVSPNILKNMVIGFALGVVLTIAVIVIRHITDDTIKSQDDIEKYLGMSTLASIPMMADSEWDGDKSSKNTKNKKGNKTNGTRNSNSKTGAARQTKTTTTNRR